MTAHIIRGFVAAAVITLAAPFAACVDVTDSLVTAEDPVDLGSVMIGEVLEGVVVFENQGEHDIEIRLAGWEDDGGETLRFQGALELPTVVFPDDQYTLPVAFKADLPGDYAGELSVSYGKAGASDDVIGLTVGVGATAVAEGADEDGDGWPIDGGDCDDNDPDVNPDAEEACNGHDDDCDGEVPEDEVDEDGDGVMVCGGDCDDTDDAVHPGAEEGCDGIDTDCDGVIEDDMDDDGDGHTVCLGDCDDSNADVYPGADEGCDGIDTDCDGLLSHDEEDADADGHSICEGDCADDDDTVYPGAPELCNGHDDDCDGAADADEVDADGDGVMVCGGDCDDGAAEVYPGAPEACNGADDDCDGFPSQNEEDLDGDGYMVCDGDCADDDDTVYPGAPELCNGHDDDCDGGLGAGEEDADGDGLMGCDGDCDDSDPAVYPGAPEVCDTVDNDCDGDLFAACTSCDDILQGGLSTGDGTYTVDVDGVGGYAAVDVLCDMTTDGGGWTLVQKTTDDWGDTGQLVTDYDTFREQTLGNPNGAFRLAGELWPDLAAGGEVLMIAVPRDQSGAPCQGPLRYTASGATFDFPLGGPATVDGVQQTVEILSGDTLTTTDTGPATNCLNNDAVPWFLASCCEACPTYGGSFFSPPSPMVRFLDTDPDMDGLLADDVCTGAVEVSNGYVGVWQLGFLLR